MAAPSVSLETLQAQLQSIEKTIKSLQRSTHKLLQRLDDPTGEKAKSRSENNSFKKPQKVSDQLRAFLKLGDDELISRSDVTKRVFAYAKENNLNNGKVINLDPVLRDLLRPAEGQDVTVTNLQKYINHHYIKDSTATTTASTTTTTASKKPRVTKKTIVV